MAADLKGMRFGKLIAIEPTGKSCHRGRYWLCKCDCGGMVEAQSSQLLSGNRKSCGCLSRPPLKDLVGKQFGDLTIVSYAGKKNGSHFWHCRCRCGNELDVQQTNLQSGHTASCGCRNNIKNKIHFVHGTSVELIQSQTLSKANTSGIKGVHWSKNQQRWIAQITFQGKKQHIGSYRTIEEATIARKEAEEKTFGEFLQWYHGQNEP